MLGGGEIGGGSVAGIAGEDLTEETSGDGALAKAETSLGFEKERGSTLAPR